MSEYQLELERKHPVRIHIDQNPYESPNPTTGEALYILGEVPVGLELYREVTGDKEDQQVENGPDTVHLKEDEHFHSGPTKVYTIYVSGQKKEVMTKRLTFADIVALAYPTPPTGQDILYTISYEDGPRDNPQGAVAEKMALKKIAIVGLGGTGS